jgi:hypothetical protein
VGLGRRIVRKSVRRATPRPIRKAMHPVRTATNAVTPRSVKKLSRGVYTVSHPVGAIENKAIGAVLYAGSPGRRSTARRAPTYVQVQRQADAAQRAQQQSERLQLIADLQELITALLTAHEQSFAPAQRQVIEPPTRHEPSEFEPALRHEYLTGVSIFQRAARRDLRLLASRSAQDASDAANIKDATEHKRQQAEEDWLWAKLVSGEPNMVLRTLNAAFDDNPTRTLAIRLTDGLVEVIVVQPNLDDLPTQTPAVTRGGKPTLHKMTKTQRCGLWTQATFSNAVATLCETAAVAPSITAVKIVVVRGETDPQPVLIGTFMREQIGTWGSIDDPVFAFAYSDGHLFFDEDRFGALLPLTLSESEWTGDLVRQLLADPTPVTDPDIGDFIPPEEASRPSPNHDAGLTFVETQIDVDALNLPGADGTTESAAIDSEVVVGIDPRVPAAHPSHPPVVYQGMNGRLEAEGRSIVISRVDHLGLLVPTPYPYPIRLPLEDIVGVYLLPIPLSGIGYLQVQGKNDVRSPIDASTAASEPYTVCFGLTDWETFRAVAQWMATTSGCHITQLEVA